MREAAQLRSRLAARHRRQGESTPDLAGLGRPAATVVATILPTGALAQNTQGEKRQGTDHDGSYGELIEERVQWKPKSLPP